ncbi:MAG: hypothetical protein AMJ81_12635 [Phycisphaerae bacterium SM23_33]|jgi:tetratricopeptide (TPR) repeat protein|nr:MAG: hypothetical protein AMJ81_12635 [Phycisphaerae bacterium SM23_33]
MTISQKTVIAAIAGGWILAGMVLMLVAGCDAPPPPPRAANGKLIDTLAVNPWDPAEAAAASKFLAAEVQYKHALNVLSAYYVEIGAYDKQQWVGSEIKNLSQVRPWRLEGVPAPTEPAPQSVEDATEAALVEQALAARREWKDSLEALAEHYRKNSLGFKLAMVRNVQQRFDRVREYSYFLHAEIPPATLHPTEVIPAADELFAQALKTHKRGKLLPAITDYKKQRQALLTFLELVRKYPTSTKAALSAYYIGDIYKEYFNENIRAVQWYQRAWEWDPGIMQPARFQAAVVYDFRLAQYAKAVDLYGQAIQHEQFNQSNVNFARTRIEELTGRK